MCKKVEPFINISHLFSQATVSASLFKDMDDYKQKFMDQLRARWPNEQFPSINNYLSELTFVYAIGVSKPGDLIDILPIFSKINLLKHARLLNRFGFKVEVARIELV